MDPGEKALEAALREVREETGITASLMTKLADIKYMYVRSGETASGSSKSSASTCCVMSQDRSTTFLKRCGLRSRAPHGFGWQDAPKLLAYKGEKQMARQALEYVTTTPSCDRVLWKNLRRSDYHGQTTQSSPRRPESHLSCTPVSISQPPSDGSGLIVEASS